MDSQSSCLSQEPLSLNSDDSTKRLSRCRDGKKSKLLKEYKEVVKRMKHPENWKVNVKKNARLRGEEYIGVGGNCKMHSLASSRRKITNGCIFYFV